MVEKRMLRERVDTRLTHLSGALAGGIGECCINERMKTETRLRRSWRTTDSAYLAEGILMEGGNRLRPLSRPCSEAIWTTA